MIVVLCVHLHIIFHVLYSIISARCIDKDFPNLKNTKHKEIKYRFSFPERGNQS
jgi:hypothetical protein